MLTSISAIESLLASKTVLDLGVGVEKVAPWALGVDERSTAADLRADVSPGSTSLLRALKGRLFDVVFIHDAIDYMLTLQELRRALFRAAVHCKPGGLALFVPDYVRETFVPSTDHGGTDAGRRGLRYLEWTYDPLPGDSTYVTEFAYLLRKGEGQSQLEYDRHICGLFFRAEWLQLLQEVGFQPEIIRDPFERELFLAQKINSVPDAIHGGD